MRHRACVHVLVEIEWFEDDRRNFRGATFPGPTQLGRVHECRGVSPVPAFFYIGREWQNNRGSALLRAVGACISKTDYLDGAGPHR